MKQLKFKKLWALDIEYIDGKMVQIFTSKYKKECTNRLSKISQRIKDTKGIIQKRELLTDKY